jgi:hypothetical protein
MCCMCERVRNGGTDSFMNLLRISLPRNRGCYRYDNNLGDPYILVSYSKYTISLLRCLGKNSKRRWFLLLSFTTSR